MRLSVNRVRILETRHRGADYVVHGTSTWDGDFFVWMRGLGPCNLEE